MAQKKFIINGGFETDAASVITGNLDISGNLTAADVSVSSLDIGGSSVATVDYVDTAVGGGGSGSSSAGLPIASSDGYVTLDTNSIGTRLNVLTDNTLRLEVGSLGITVAGEVYASGNVVAYSDASLKTNVEVIPNALDKVSSLSGYTYTRVDTGDVQTGVIAQEVLEVLPEAVMGGPTEEDPDGKYAVAYGNMVGLLIEAIKEQQSKIEELTSIVNSLAGEK